MNQKTKTEEADTVHRILLVDDQPKNLMLLSDILTHNGFQVGSTTSGKMALKYLENNTPQLILLDVKMPEMDGFELCRQLKSDEKYRGIPVIFISALNEIDDKIAAFKAGGVDYITKPFQEEEVLARVNTHITIQTVRRELTKEVLERKEAQKALQKSYNDIEEIVIKRTAELEDLKNRLKQENVYLQEEIKTNHNFTEIIGTSKKLRKTLGLVKQVAASETTVLILGETGTGKELIARAVHNLSKRKDRPLVKVNCAAIPSNLIESELFGHEKGAFTGAIARKIGRFELADKGTIFLDEIGDLPLELQAKLLRVLQEGEFERLGSSKTMRIDTRVLTATNRNLEELRTSGGFRDDLFYRLNVFPIESPPLRERKEDIPLLVRHFVEKFNKKTGKQITIIPNKAADALERYPWPGNVRELENIIERAIILSPGEQLLLGDWLSESGKSAGCATLQTLDELQKHHIIRTLELTSGKVAGKDGAAKILGLNRSTLLTRMKKLGITIDKKTVGIPANAGYPS